VVQTGSETYFNHINNLGSTTSYTNHSGAAAEDMAFYPWGDVWLSWGSGGYNFASLPYRDTTTTTDLTMFRVSSPNLGRWHSPDLLGGDVTNPQSLNRYAYVMNNPTTGTDLLGLFLTDADCDPATDSSCPGGSGSAGGGYNTNPVDPCSDIGYSDANASCQQPGGFLNGQPIPPVYGDGGTGGGGGVGSGGPPPQPPSPGGSTEGAGPPFGWPNGGGIPGTPDAFQQADVLDWPFYFRVISWGWPYILRGVAAVGSVPGALPATLMAVLFSPSSVAPHVHQARKPDLRQFDEAVRRVEKRCGGFYKRGCQEKTLQPLRGEGVGL